MEEYLEKYKNLIEEEEESEEEEEDEEIVKDLFLDREINSTLEIQKARE